MFDIEEKPLDTIVPSQSTQSSDRYIIEPSHSSYYIIDTHSKSREDRVLAITLCPNNKKENAYQKAAFITALLNAYDRGPVSISESELTSSNHTALLKRLEDIEFAFGKLKNWCMAYPLDIFYEPDMNKVREVLSAADIEISCVSFSNMRYVLKGVQEIIDPFLTDDERKKINACLSE